MNVTFLEKYRQELYNNVKKFNLKAKFKIIFCTIFERTQLA
jgi:hypothetical protein